MAWHQFATRATNYRSFGGDFDGDFKLRKLGYNPHHWRVGWILKAQNLDLHLPGLWMDKTWLHVHFGLSWDRTNIWNDKLLLIYVHSKHHSSYLWLLIYIQGLFIDDLCFMLVKIGEFLSGFLSSIPVVPGVARIVLGGFPSWFSHGFHHDWG